MGGLLSSPVVRIPAAAASFGTSELAYNKPGTFGFTERDKFAGSLDESTGGTLNALGDGSKPAQAQEIKDTADAAARQERQNLAAKALADERQRQENSTENIRQRAGKAASALGLQGSKRPSASSYLAGVSP